MKKPHICQKMFTKKKDPDTSYLPGFTRKKEGYDRTRDNRNVTKQLQALKGE